MPESCSPAPRSESTPGSPEDSRSQVPSTRALKAAEEKLRDCLDKAISQLKHNLKYNNGDEICDAVELFVHELYEVPSWRAELERRAGLIEQRCAKGTPYDKEKCAALGGDHGAPKRSLRSSAAINRLSKGYPNPYLLSMVVDERKDLEVFLREGELAPDSEVRAAFQAWFDQCGEIKRTATRLETDGCYYLFHIYRAWLSDPPNQSQFVQAAVKDTWMGIDAIPLMREAAETLVDWAARIEGNGLIGVPESPAAGQEAAPSKPNESAPATDTRRKAATGVGSHRNKGGRKSKWDHFWKYAEDNPGVTDKDTAKAYCTTFGAAIAKGTRQRPTAETLRQLRYDRTKRKR